MRKRAPRQNASKPLPKGVPRDGLTQKENAEFLVHISPAIILMTNTTLERFIGETGYPQTSPSSKGSSLAGRAEYHRCLRREESRQGSSIGLIDCRAWSIECLSYRIKSSRVWGTRLRFSEIKPRARDTNS